MEQITNHPLYKVHTIDTVMNSMWEFYKKKFITLFLTSFVMGLVLQYLSSLIDISEIQSVTDLNEIMLKLKAYLWPMLLVMVVSLFFTSVLHYYVIYNPLDAATNMLQSIAKSLKYFIPYIIIMVLLVFAASFALFLGLLLLVVGVLFAGLYVMTIYLFILPVMMVEGPNIGNTISRSLNLSHRNFWSNMGWTAVFVILILVLTTILSGVVLLPFTGSFLKVFTNPQEAASLVEITTKPLYIVLSALLNAITFPLLPVYASILYFNGRAREENKSPWGSMTDDNNGKVKVEDLYAKPIHDEKDDNTV